MKDRSELVQPPKATELARRMVSDVIAPGDVVVDATAGNGHDTLFLAEAVGVGGRVLAFDVQASAITAAYARVKDSGFLQRVEFFQESHARMDTRVGEAAVAVVMMNLGYLPGGDRRVITSTAETMSGLAAADRVLKPGGWLTVICYPGHDGGDDEAVAVADWLSRKASVGWRVAKYDMPWTLRPAPCLYAAVKGPA